MIRSLMVVSLLGASVSLADDRSACAAGDERACARVGELKSAGALKADGSKDASKLVDVCAKALEAVKGPADFRSLSRSCSQLYNADMKKTWDALGGIDMPGLDQLFTTGLAEAYCPRMMVKAQGCTGKKAARVSSSADAMTVLKYLHPEVIKQELGEEAASKLNPLFAAAWPKVFGSK